MTEVPARIDKSLVRYDRSPVGTLFEYCWIVDELKFTSNGKILNANP